MHSGTHGICKAFFFTGVPKISALTNVSRMAAAKRILTPPGSRKQTPKISMTTINLSSSGARTIFLMVD